MATCRLGVLLAAAAAVCLSGCASYRGVERINKQVDFRTGTIVDVKKSPRSLGLAQIFANDLSAAYKVRATSGALQEEIADRNLAMLKSGLALVRANCTEYFNAMGRSHRNSRVLRDLVTPVTNVITGLVAMNLFSDAEVTNGNILKGLAIGSSAYSAGLDIYDNRFLFGSDNIGSVRTLVINALSSHQQSLEARPPDDFVFVVTHLLDNEDICTPPQILRLVRESLSSATPKPKDDGNAGDLADGVTNNNVARPVSVEPEL